jgi:hypothetical protein
MKPLELPPGLLSVRIPKGWLILTEAEFSRALRRGRYFLRQAALAQRTKPDTGGIKAVEPRCQS